MFLIAAGAMAGYMESHRLALRVERLESFLKFLSAAQTEIRFSARPVDQIVRRYGNELPFLKACANCFENGTDFFTAWQHGVNHSGLCDKDKELFNGFGRSFGTSDTEGQISHCALYYELTSLSLKEAKEEKDRKSKLYQMFGIFSGMAAALLLC